MGTWSIIFGGEALISFFVPELFDSEGGRWLVG